MVRSLFFGQQKKGLALPQFPFTHRVAGKCYRLNWDSDYEALRVA
jgi:hypothetical protein